MVVDTKEEKTANGLFHALSDATRRSILVQTLENEFSVSDLARLYPMSFAAVQKHVAVLERAELVSKRRQGREQMVSGNVVAIQRAFDLLEQIEEVWRNRIGRMEEILAQDSRKGERE